MKKRTLFCVCAVVGMVLPAVAARAQADLSGTWVQDPQKTMEFVRSSGLGPVGGSATPEGGALPATVTLTITQAAGVITIERSAGGSSTKVSYKLDGSNTENRLDDQVTTSRTRWENGKLVTTGTFVGRSEGASSGTFTETRWLDAAGTLFLDQVRAYGGMKFIERYAYIRKRP